MGKIRIVLIVSLLLSGFNTHAQMVTYRKETIFKGNKPYAFLEKSGSSWAKEFTLKNLAKENLIYIKPVSKNLTTDYDFVYYVIVFKGFTEKAEMQDDDDFDRILAYEFARLKILENDTLNPEAVSAFLDKFPAGKFSGKFIKGSKPLEKPDLKALKNQTPGNASKTKDLPQDSVAKKMATGKNLAVTEPENNTDYPIEAPPLLPASSENVAPWKQNSQKQIVVNGNAILKGKKKLATFELSEKKAGSVLKKVVAIRNRKNKNIATATFNGNESSNCQLFTYKDRKSRTLPVTDSPEVMQAIALYLLQEGYL